MVLSRNDNRRGLFCLTKEHDSAKKCGGMFLFKVFILNIIFLLFAFPVYASDHINTIQDDQPVAASLLSEDDEKQTDLFQPVADYSSNEYAVKAVKKNIVLFTGKMRERFSIWLSRSGKYIELMKGILHEKDIPEEIVFLPLIESGFNPYAYSPKKAAGYWQFIASTARIYGLEINWWRDERRDPVKSTTAAGDYLKDLYEMFGSWNLAMAAYNAGEGKIRRALRKTKADDYWDLQKTSYIKRETKNYVPRFIAASLIANSPHEFGFEDLEYLPPLNYDTVIIESPVDLEIAAQCAETSHDIIKELNPELKRWCTPPDVTGYLLKIPEGSEYIFLQNLSEIPEEERLTVDRYIVKRGDTLTKIAKITRVPLKVIRDLNLYKDINPLKIGDELSVPPKGKYTLDRDDKALMKKTPYGQKQKGAGQKNTRKKTKSTIYRQKMHVQDKDYRKI
jgi:membrane-bound lytic murein transglycosylase D